MFFVLSLRPPRHENSRRHLISRWLTSYTHAYKPLEFGTSLNRRRHSAHYASTSETSHRTVAIAYFRKRPMDIFSRRGAKWSNSRCYCVCFSALLESSARRHPFRFSDNDATAKKGARKKVHVLIDASRYLRWLSKTVRATLVPAGFIIIPFPAHGRLNKNNYRLLKS